MANLHVPFGLGVSIIWDQAGAVEGLVMLSANACAIHLFIATFRAAVCMRVGSRERLSALNAS